MDNELILFHFFFLSLPIYRQIFKKDTIMRIYLLMFLVGLFNFHLHVLHFYVCV